MILNPFPSLPLWLNLIVGGIAAAAIWYAGTRLERYTDAISGRTGLGKAFLGLLILATVTSLPELATTVTAVLADNVDLAVHNLLGGVVAQTTVLALADIYFRKGALTHFTPNFVLLVQGVGLIMLLATALIAIILAGTMTLTVTVQDSTLTFNPVPWSLLVLFLIVLYLTHRHEGYVRWRPTDAPVLATTPPVAQVGDGVGSDSDAGEEENDEENEREERSLTTLLLHLVLASLGVLVAGWAVASIGDTLAEQTGLGSSFIGFTLVSLATSLPEVSTVLAAIRDDNYSMGVSNIFGSNSFDVTLLFVVAILSGGPALLFEAEPTSAMYAAALGIFMTGVYMWGLLEREDRTFLGIGWDSLVTVLFYLLGTATIFLLR